GDKIIAIRKYKKISQTDLAQKANLSQAFISHIEQGKRNPTINTIEKIAKGLNIALKEFLLYIIGDLNIKFLHKEEGQNVIMESKEITN
ncbi:MAG: helix-turn-helix domain-containing protein, partial [bacterium]